MTSVLGLYRSAFDALDRLLWPVADLGLRLWMASIFLAAGLQRLRSWDSQAFLFSDIHPVPFLPAGIAAPLTTAGELALPVLVGLGLLTRLGTAGLLVMTAVIELVVARTPQGLENHIGNPQHWGWMAVLLLLTLRGPGPLSVDTLLMRGLRRHSAVA